MKEKLEFWLVTFPFALFWLWIIFMIMWGGAFIELAGGKL